MARPPGRQVPYDMRESGCTDFQNYILWIVTVEPRTLMEIADVTGMHYNTVRNNIKVLEDKELIKKFQHKVGNAVQYIRSRKALTVVGPSETLEPNGKLFKYGAELGSIIDFINAFHNPESKLAALPAKVAGILAHVWVRQYQIKANTKELLKYPEPAMAKEYLQEEIERVEKFVQVLKDIRDSEFFTQELTPTTGLLSNAQHYVKAYQYMASDWLMELKDNHAT